MVITPVVVAVALTVIMVLTWGSSVPTVQVKPPPARVHPVPVTL